MNNRFLEMYDIENKPIFEKDRCIINLKNNSFGLSKFGEKLKKINPKKLIVDFNNNKNELKKSIIIKFCMDDEHFLTNEEYCQLTKKNINEYLNIKKKKKNDIYQICSEDSMFISYVTYNMILKETIDNKEAYIEKDEDFIVKLNNLDLKLNEKVFFKRNKKIEDFFDFYIKKNNVIDFDGVLIELNRYRNFKWGINISFCDKEIKPCVKVYKKLKPEYDIKKSELLNLISVLTHSMSHENSKQSIKIKELIEQLKDFDKKCCYLEEMDSNIFIGIGKDEETLNFLIDNSDYTIFHTNQKDIISA